MKRTLPVVGLIALAIVAGGTWYMYGSRAREAPAATHEAPLPPTALGSNTLRFHAGAPQLDMIMSQPLAAGAVPLSDSLSARIVYDEDATARIGVGVSGRITAIKASIGDTVKAGQVLAEVDSPDYGTAIADLEKARTDEDHKRRAVARAKELVPGEAIPLKDWESLQADLAQAHAETLRAQERLRNLNPRGLAITGQLVKLTSPIPGIVADRNATPALEVSPGSDKPLFVVTDPHKLWLLIDLPERLLGKVKKGSKVEVHADAWPDQHFTATILQLGQAVDPNTRRVTLRASIDNPDLKLLPEMFVRAHLLQDVGTGVRVPNSAIVNAGLYTYVYVETNKGEFTRRKVSLTAQGSDASYVGEGLTDGERVVTTGALLLDAELAARAGDKS